MKLEGGRSEIELCIKVVLERLVGSKEHVSLGVGKVAGVHLQQVIEGRPEVDVVQVGGEGALLRVEVDLSLVEDSVADSKIEDGGVALAVAGLRLGNVGDAVLIDE